MSRILAIESSTIALSVGLQLDNHIVEKFEIAERQQAKLLLPMIDSLLNEASIKLDQLDAIAFGRGPGSFTGIRIATGITQGLAYAKDLPVIPVSTLQIMAQGALRVLGAKQVLVTLDARMKEIYFGRYVVDDNGAMQPIKEDALLRSDDVLVPPDDGSWVSVGDEFYPHAQDLLQIANVLYQQGKTVSAEMALPVYLRSKEAWR